MYMMRGENHFDHCSELDDFINVGLFCFCILCKHYCISKLPTYIGSVNMHYGIPENWRILHDSYFKRIMSAYTRKHMLPRN